VLECHVLGTLSLALVGVIKRECPFILKILPVALNRIVVFKMALRAKKWSGKTVISKSASMQYALCGSTIAAFMLSSVPLIKYAESTFKPFASYF
jgi:hypothetical protein